MGVDVTNWPHNVVEPKDSGAVLDYVIDWSDWLAEGRTLASATWTVSDPVVVIKDQTETPTAARAVIAGGTSGTSVTLTCHVVDDTAPVALEDERSLVIKIKSR